MLRTIRSMHGALATGVHRAMWYLDYNERKMRFVTAREANQGFSRILREAEEGESVVILRRGRPVALLAPYPTADTEERKRAITQIVGLMRQGVPIGGRPFTRDEMHERG
jgi:prevent-host-death family protein